MLKGGGMLGKKRGLGGEGGGMLTSKNVREAM